MNFQFGCAKKLYELGVHPRVLVGPEDLKRLRQTIRSGDGLKVMTALRKKIRPLVQSVFKTGDLPELLAWKSRSWNDPGILLLMGIRDVALVAALDEDAEAIEALLRLFIVVTQPWGASGAPHAENFGKIDSLAAAYDLAYPYLPEEIRAAYRVKAAGLVRRKLETGRTHFFKNSGANTPLGTMLPGLEILLSIKNDPGVEKLDKEQAELILMLEASLHTAINVDGYPEEDIGYGTSVAGWLGNLADMALRAGLYDGYRECPRLARFGQAMLHFVQPWGENLSNTGDHGDDFGGRESSLARLAMETKDPSLLWLLGTLYYTHGNVHPENTLPDYYIEVPLRKGFRTPATAQSIIMLEAMKGEKHPAELKLPTAYRDRGRGIVSFRSGWDPDATFVVFDGSQRSPSAQGHPHASGGHFSISALGEYFAIDTGRYNNEQSCHNVVLVDGKSGRSNNGEWISTFWHGNLTDYRPDPICDFAAADSSQQHNCFWARRALGLVKGAGAPGYVWTVEDINKANDWADYWWQLHTSPENTIAIHGDSATVRGWRHGNELDVHFALPAAGSYPKDHVLALTQDVGTHSSMKYCGDLDAIERNVKRFKRPADMVHGPVYARPRLLAKVGGYNGRVMSVMIPRRKGAAPAAVERIPSLDNSLAMRLVFPAVEDILIFAYEHNLLEAADVKGSGQWCVVRRDRKTRRVLAHAIKDGVYLKAGGKTLV